VTAQDVEGIADAGPAVATPPAGILRLAGSRVPAQPGRDRGVVVADPPGGEAGQVLRRGEEPGVAGHAAHQAGVLVVYDAGPGCPVPARLSGREVASRPVRQESYGGQPERAGHQAADGLVERFAGGGRRHLAEGDEARVRVADPGSRGRLQRGQAELAEQAVA